MADEMMVDLTKVLNSIHVNDSDAMKSQVTELRDITSQCLKKLQGLRAELTAAYISGQNIVIKEGEEYFFKNEKDVRREKKQGLEVDIKQRQEEKILKGVLKSLSLPKKEKLNVMHK